MRRLAFFASLAPLVLLAGAPGSGSGDDIQAVAVTNFPETQQVRGVVALEQPAPTTRLLTIKDLVTPAAPTQVGDITDAGTIDSSGFAFATLSLAVLVQGTLAAPGRVGAILIPDQPEVLAVFRTHGIFQFPLTVEAPVSPSVSGLHQSSSVTARLAFPRYRVFLYNTTPRTSEITLYVYLGNS